MAKITKSNKKINKKKTSKKVPKKLKFKSKGFSLRSLIIVGISFAVVGSYLVYTSLAASTINALSTKTSASEDSGLIASRQYPNVYWWMRDGGDATASQPRDAIYALKFDNSGNPVPVRGNDKFPFYMISGASNNNWEDIAMDEDNNIWIGDIGANICTRKNQKIFKIKEPNPSGTETLSVMASYTFQIPDPEKGCNTWNSEAMFWLDGKMYIIAKSGISTIYRMDLPSGNSGTAKLVRIGQMKGGASNLSASSISDDRSRFMVAAHQKMKVYTSTNKNLKGDDLVKDFISRTPAFEASFDCKCGNNANVEGGAFKRNSYDIAFVSEGKYIYYATPKDYGDSAKTSNPAPTTPTPSGEDKTDPIVKITSPSNNSRVNGTITINVEASDNVGLTQVKILYDNSKVIRGGTEQGKYGWGSRFDTTQLSNGTHTLDAIAYDAAGNKSTSQVTVNVRN